MRARRPRPLARRALVALAALVLATTGAGCGDDGGSTVDAAPACTLPSAIVTCTAGDSAPCTALCANAYCFTFNRVGTVCTEACAVATDCPAGWTCNNMGRCRPPG